MIKTLAFLKSKQSNPKRVHFSYLAFQIYGPFLRQDGPQRLQKPWLLEMSRNDELKKA